MWQSDISPNIPVIRCRAERNVSIKPFGSMLLTVRLDSEMTNNSPMQGTLRPDIFLIKNPVNCACLNTSAYSKYEKSLMKKLGVCIGWVILALLEGPTVRAADFVIAAGQTVTTTQSLADGETGVVEIGGSLQPLLGDAINAGNNTTITNRGILSVSSGSATGIRSGQNAAILNSGTITAERNFSAGITAEQNSMITNSGTISSTAALFTGIGSGTNVSVTNLGTIVSPHNGINTSDSEINNSGKIVSTGYGGTSNSAGIRLNGTSGSTVTNSGLIIGGPDIVPSQRPDAIRFSFGPDTLNILSGARFHGTLDFGLGGNDQVNIQWKDEVSSLWNFDGFDTATGDSISVNSPNPYVVTNSAVSILDPTGFASAATSLADLTNSLHGTVHRHLRQTGLTRNIPQHDQQPIQVASTASRVPIPSSSSAWNFWMQGFGGKTKRQGERATLGYDHQSWGVIGGGTLSPSSRVRIGLFGGLADSKTDVGPDVQTLDARSGFGGIFGQFALEPWFFHSSFAGGFSSTDSDRLVLNNLTAGGSQRTNAGYTSGFISTAMTSGVHVREFLDGIALRPSVSLAYAAEWIPDYQESGSSADLTVDDRVVQILTGQVEMAVLLAHFDNRLRQEIRGGGFGRDQVGSEKVQVILLNQPLSFSTSTEDSLFGGSAGYGVAYDVMNAVTISADYAAQLSKDIFSHNVRFGLAIGF